MLQMRLTAYFAYIQCNVLQTTQSNAMTTVNTKEAATRTINVRVPSAVYEQLESLAKATSRTKSFVALEALSSYLNEHSWQINDIEAAIAEADKGDFATESQVKTVLGQYGA
jgi:predicted transcriptional regulator